jgi:Putative phage tail protein
MPAAAAAAVAAALASYGAAVVAVAYAVTYAVVAFAISYAVGSIMGAIFKPRSNNGFSAEAQGRTQVVRSNVQPRNMIYGRAMTSGPLIFAASSDGPSKKNQFMHLVIALADHECDAIEEVYLGEYPVNVPEGQVLSAGGAFLKTWGESATQNFLTGGVSAFGATLDQAALRVTTVVARRWEYGEVGLIETELTDYTLTSETTITVRGVPAGAQEVVVNYEAKRSHSYVRLKRHLGGTNQGADADLVAEVPGWTWDHRLAGVTYIYLRLEYDSDIYPNGLPNVKALVRGKKLYDPRTGVTAWSDNWALCVYDYLKDVRGFGCADEDIDLQSVLTAANVSSEYVEFAPGKFDQRYRCNGIVMSDKSPRDNLAEMISAGGGTVTITGGVFRVFAGAYDIPSVTLTEDDLRGAVKVRPRTSRKDLFNQVKGTFVDPAHNWQPGDFPIVGNALYSQQDGETIARDIELPFTTEVIMAQRLAKIILERSRQQIVVEFPAKLSAFRLTAYSTVKVSLAKFGWTDKVFRVMDWKMTDTGGIDLVLNEEAATVYDWSLGNATVRDPAPDTNLPDPFFVENLGAVSVDSGEQHLIINNNGQVVTRMLVSWPPVADVALTQNGRVELQYKRTDASAWTSLPTVTADTTSLYVSPVEDGVGYLVRGRLVSALGVRSQLWSYSPLHVVVGKLAPPANLTGLSMTAINGFANLTWDPATDLDVRNGGRASIRHTTDLVQPSWGSAIDLGGIISGAANSAQLPLLAGVYLAKWIDSTGHESPTAAMVITTAPSLDALNVVATISEAPAFAGMKSAVILDPSLNGLKLVGSSLIDDQGLIDASGLWDSQGAVDGLGLVDAVVGAGGWGLIDSLGGIVDTGTYYFANEFDLGSVEKCRLTATVDTIAFDTGDLIDFRYDSIDTWESIDGDRINDTAVTLYVRTTQDNPAGTPVWTGWQRFAMGDYDARAFQWKVVLDSASATHNVLVTGLTVGIDMPDRRESGLNVVSGAGIKTITFDKEFRIVPVKGITAKNMTQGDYFVITDEQTTHFKISFFNAANAPVSRTFDWDAVAY